MNSIYKIWFKPGNKLNPINFNKETGISSTEFLWEQNFNTEKEALKEVKLSLKESNGILDQNDYQIIRFDLN